MVVGGDVVGEAPAGPGYRYMLRHIARADTDATAEQPRSLAGYYASSGYPPGIGLGQGLVGVAGGAGVTAGSQMCEEQMARLFGQGVNPVTGNALGRAYRTGRGGRLRWPVLI